MDAGRRTGWLGTLGPAIGAVAGAMLVAGVYLLDPAAVDLGFELEAARTWIVGAFLIAAAAALVFKLAFPKGLESGSLALDTLAMFTLGDIAHFAYAFIALGIGGEALIASPANYWAALFLVPGMVSLAIAFSDDDDEDADKGAGEPDEDAEDDETSADGDRVTVGEAGRMSLFLGALFAGYMIAIALLVSVGIWTHQRLRGAIFDGEVLDGASAAALWTAIVKVVPGVAPIAIALVAVLGAIFFLSLVLPWPSSWRSTPSAKGGLSAAGDAFVEASEKAVIAYARAQGYGSSLMDFFGFLSVMGAIGVGAIVMFGVIEFMKPQPAGPSFPLVIAPGGVSMIVGFFAFLMLWIVPQSIMSRLSRRFSERAGWVLLRPSKNPYALREKIAAFVRTGQLSTARPIDPGAFLHAANLSVERYYYVPAAVTGAVALFLLHRDLTTADVLTAETIEVTDYWTAAMTRFTYTDVRRVELRCYLTDKSATQEAYVLHFKDGQSVDIFGSNEAVAAQLAALEAIDAKLTALGVPFVPGAHQGWFKGDVPGYEPACVERLAEEFGQELQPRIKALFHLDQMRAPAAP
jgi:hypothetical protein